AAKLLGLEPLELEAVYLERDGTHIELLHYRKPGHVGSHEPRAMNARGLTHLSLRTDDLEADLASLSALGAHSLPQTRIDNPDFDSQVVFITDPDGTRIELVQMPGDPHRLPGA
ncbi:MAG: VOC family protein, partial [Myxococcota bacterium]